MVTKAKAAGQRHGEAVHNAVGGTVTAVTGTAKNVALYMREFFATAVKGADAPRAKPGPKPKKK